jgi:anti-sigma factor RsiW
MTDCPNATVRDRLPDLLHGALDAPARAAVEAHVAGCADCTSELALLRDARTSLARAPQVDVAAIVAALPRPAVAGPRLVQFPSRAARARRAFGMRVPAWAGVAAAAALALAVGIGSFALGERSGDDAAPPTLAQAEPGGTDGVPRVATPPTAEPNARAEPGAPTGDVAPLLVVNTAALSDADLAGLLEELDDLEAVPAADPLSLVPVTELPSGAGTGEGF